MKTDREAEKQSNNLMREGGRETAQKRESGTGKKQSAQEKQSKNLMWERDRQTDREREVPQNERERQRDK